MKRISELKQIKTITNNAIIPIVCDEILYSDDMAGDEE